MTKIYEVRGVRIGEGRPKIIVPIVGKDKKAILEKARSFEGLPIDVVEWRVDFYEDVFDISKVMDTLNELRMVLLEKPILFTFRTKNEGGEKEISMEEYTRLNKVVANSGLVDLIDVEIFSGDEIVRENIENIHGANVLVVGSNHDFHQTPEKDELLRRLQKMQEMGADIPKIAVMPQTPADVLVLLSATYEMVSCFADRPIITMSMSSKGVISRMAGEVFGSSMTFGAVGQVSAPGQIPVEKLECVLDILHNAM
ncbi:3-dehydroquinate dehydratase-1 [Anaerosolibacter carboniphilus]|uniref:3-dehydroquinate dehydratase n=1 Tax=Anaerosolibacter carboniphilus TaxID=1417629 RepID=A0A841KXX8_9FIRM|nr:type I 3-dehydroquinate dehydratase [Anaerosolibacter carboniphilus]MBB6215009.1 3-dehydroquinate dehydratase-1 [Anaerosolibacter carboniphilus]